MEKVYEELEELKSINEKLKIDYKNKIELVDNLKKVQNQQLVEIREARLVIEKQSFEIDEQKREISELNRTNKDLKRCLEEKISVLKHVNEANEKLRANGENKYKEFEEEKRKLMLALDEASEKNNKMEQKNNVYMTEIEGLKVMLVSAEKQKMEVEKTTKALKELRGRDDIMSKLEDEKSQLEEKLKWKKEQFKHLEEAYEKLKNLFDDSKKETEEERSMLLKEINSLQIKLDSQARILEDLQKKLEMCNYVLTQEETRRKHLEIQVSEFKARYEDTFAEYQDARTQLDELSSKRDEEVAELRQTLSIKEAYFKEVKYENGKLQQEKKELLVSLKELQEATIQGSGNSAMSKLKNKYRNLENIHKQCSANVKSKESEWSFKLEKMEEEINVYKLQLQSKEAALKEFELELENCHSSTAKMRLQYEEIYVMFLVLSKTISEAESRLANVKDDALAKANLGIEEEREKVMALKKQIESLSIVKEKNLVMEKEIENYTEMLKESEKCRVILNKLESDSKENVCEALETVNTQLFDKTSQVYQLEFQLWIWKSVAKRLKSEVEKNKNLRKRVEASLLEQVGVGEAMRQERNELLHKLKMLKNLQREVELLEEESLRKELEDVVLTAEKERDMVSCFKAELETKESELKEVTTQMTTSEAEKRNLLRLISELENGMWKLCDEDTKLMKTMEGVIQSDKDGKENNNCCETLTMKHEAVEIEDRSPFRIINY